MQEHYECQDEHQEHYEDHDEHQEHIFEKFLMQRKHARHQTYNMRHDSNKKHKNIFYFYDFLIFLDFYFIFFKNYLKGKKNKDSKIFNMNSRNLAMLVLKLQSKGQAWLNSQPSFSM